MFTAKWITISAFTLLLGLFPVYSICQNFSYTRYDVKDGLPSTIVYDITQDTDGFIWFATENGLSRFDGKNFTNFSTKDGLPDNSVLMIYADKYGKVIINPFTHPPYYFYKDSIRPLAVPGAYMADLSNTVEFFTWKGNTIIRGVKNNYFVDSTTTIKSFDSLYPPLPPVLISALVNDSTMISVDEEDSLFSLEDQKIRYIGHYRHNYSEDGFLLSFNHGVPVYTEKISSAPLTLASNSVSNNMHYASNGNGVFFFSRQTGKFLFKLDIEKFSEAFIDNESNLWITTVGNGVYRVPSLAFRHIRFDDRASDVFSVSEINQQVVAGGEFSKCFVLPKNDSSSSYTITDYSKYIEGSDNATARYTTRNRIYRLFKKANTLYIGADAFILKLTPGAKPIFKNIFPIKDIDTSGEKLLVCTGRSVLLLNTASLEVEDTLLMQRATTGVFYDGNYYIGTYGGLIRIDAKDKTIYRLDHLHHALKTRIVSIKRGFDNDLWIATSGSGVVRLKEGKVIALFNTETGLTSDMSTSMLMDTGNVWVGTNEGLNRIILNQQEPRILQFTTSNGLAANFINTIYIRDSIIYIGTAAGLTYFNKNLTHTPSVCLLEITSVSQGTDVLKKDSSYSFPYRTMNIRIGFTAISFKSAGENKYYYKMTGLDTGWNVTTNTFINYPILPPGKYTLQIYAVNKFGVTSDTKSISITIIPPWWQRWWFITAALLAIAIIILLIYRKNIRSIRLQEKTKRKNEAKLAALEQQALQAQMNPHFIFNCLNSIQRYILDLDVAGANKYLTAFASMIRQTLDNSSHPLITIANEIKYLETYLQLEKLRFKEKFNYTIEVDENIDQHNTWIPGMLLQPYIENSLRHGIQHRTDNLGVISLFISGDEEGGVRCLINDNGVGRKKAEEFKSLRHIEYQSKGTYINQKRVNAINNQFKTNIVITIKDIIDPEAAVAGTSVILDIPSFYNPEI